jgi:hypothetical protein
MGVPNRDEPDDHGRDHSDDARGRGAPLARYDHERKQQQIYQRQHKEWDIHLGVNVVLEPCTEYSDFGGACSVCSTIANDFRNL